MLGTSLLNKECTLLYGAGTKHPGYYFVTQKPWIEIINGLNRCLNTFPVAVSFAPVDVQAERPSTL